MGSSSCKECRWQASRVSCIQCTKTFRVSCLGWSDCNEHTRRVKPGLLQLQTGTFVKEDAKK